MTDHSHPDEDDLPILNLIPLYQLTNLVEAIFIGEIFDANQITYRTQNLKISAFPTEMGTQQELILSVSKDDIDLARELIVSARSSEAITTDGSFVSLPHH